MGQQVEVRVRWQVLPRNIWLEAGTAVLARGQFATEAPGAKQTTPVFVYAQLSLAI